MVWHQKQVSEPMMTQSTDLYVLITPHPRLADSRFGLYAESSYVTWLIFTKSADECLYVLYYHIYHVLSLLRVLMSACLCMFCIIKYNMIYHS